MDSVLKKIEIFSRKSFEKVAFDLAVEIEGLVFDASLQILTGQKDLNLVIPFVKDNKTYERTLGFVLQDCIAYGPQKFSGWRFGLRKIVGMQPFQKPQEEIDTLKNIQSLRRFARNLMQRV